MPSSTPVRATASSKLASASARCSIEQARAAGERFKKTAMVVR